MRKLFLPALGGLIAAFVVLAAAAGAEAADTPKRGGKLIIAQDEGPDRIDPHGISMAVQHSVVVNGPYEALLTYDKDFTIMPSLATKWVAESPTSYLFTLREGVKFHDGADFTSDDVVFTFDRILDPKKPTDAGVKMRMIKSVTAVNKYTVRFELKGPSAPFLRYMAAPETTGIVSRGFTMAHNNDLTKEANGTGAFKIVRYQAGVGIEYVKFDQYWDKNLPYLDALELRVIPDNSTRIAALRTGEVNMTYFRPDKRPLLLPLKNVVLSEITTNAIEPMRVNCTIPPLDKLEVRQALALAIDKDALMKTVLPGGLARASLMVPPADKVYGYQGDGTDLPYWKPDYAKAKALLAAAGHPNGITLKIQYINTPAFAINNRIAEVMKQQVIKAGITLNLEPVEYATLLANSAAGKYELSTSGRGMYPDPEGGLTDALATNPRSYCKDPRFDELLNQANAELDPPKRKELLIAAQKLLLEQGFYVFLFGDPLRIEVWKNDVKGYVPMPLLRRPSLRETWLDR